MPTIGYWMESLNDDRFLAPQEIAGKLDSDIAEQVLAYLREGTLYKQYRGISWCRFVHKCSEEFVGSSELTDGYWIWTEGLIHYVEVHRVTLPKDFLADALSESAIKRKSIEPDPGLDFWINWCKQNQDPTFRNRLTNARQLFQFSPEEERLERGWRPQEAQEASVFHSLLYDCGQE